MVKKKEGINFEFLSQNILKNKSYQEKLDLIMEKVKKNNIIVLEETLSPEEKKKLIEESMKNIDDNFSGIEFMGFDSEATFFERMWEKITGKNLRTGLVIVGPSKLIEKVEEKKDSVLFLAKVD